MGMFDSIRCEYPLPESEGHQEFQTKDMDCLMDSYVITKEGKLFLQGGVDPIPYHGLLNFYRGNTRSFGFGYAVTSDGGPRKFCEYNAKFSDGRIVEVTGGCQVDEQATVVSEMEFDRLCREARQKLEERDRATFDRALGRWVKETAIHSAWHLIMRHPGYVDIVAMGARALPLIFERLQSGDGSPYLYCLLHEITGVDPVREDHTQDHEEVRKDWLHWGKQNGYVSK